MRRFVLTESGAAAIANARYLFDGYCIYIFIYSSNEFLRFSRLSNIYIY